MALFRVSVPHTLGREQARVRVERFLDEVRRDYADRISDVRGEWTDHHLDFSFVAMGLAIRGSLVVQDDQVEVSGPLPLAAMFFRGQIEQTMRQELEKLLN